MKRWLRNSFIAVYLAALSYGIGCHTLGYGVGQHPMMYFIVWDMFCGWSAYTSRTYIIAEGESQKYYELAPGPWGEMRPWGPLGRHHYDAYTNFSFRQARNTLLHTRHEPITRIFVVEECWPKKFDLPEHIWNMRYDEPKDIQKYCHLRVELTGDGQLLHSYVPWYQYQEFSMLTSNPRLVADAAKGRPLLMVDLESQGTPTAFGRGTERGGTRAPRSPVGSLHGN